MDSLRQAAERMAVGVGVLTLMGSGGEVSSLEVLRLVSEATGEPYERLITISAAALRQARDRAPDTIREERVSDHVRY